MKKEGKILIILSYILLILVFAGWHNARSNTLENEAYEQGLEEGKKQGFEEGKKIGYQKGYDEAMDAVKLLMLANVLSGKTGNAAHTSNIPCVFCSGRGVTSCTLCNGQGCVSCDNTGVNQFFMCKGRGYK